MKIVYWLKQLLPLTYWTKYRTADNNVHFCIWRMWLGRSFDVTDIVID